MSERRATAWLTFTLTLIVGLPTYAQEPAQRPDLATDETAAGSAVERGTRDAEAYEAAARSLYLANDRGVEFALHQRLRPTVAREIVDLISSSISLRPDNRAAYELLVRGIVCLYRIDDEDLQILQAGRRLYPEDGVVLVGLAASAWARLRKDDALRLIRRARGDAFDLSPELAAGARALEDKWVATAWYAEVEELVLEDALDTASAEVEAILADDESGLPSRRAAEELRDQIAARRIEIAYLDALHGRDVIRGRAFLEAVAADPATSSTTLEQVQRMLETLSVPGQ